MFGAMTVPRSELLSALNWLVEAGADEAVRDTPTDRFVAVPGRNSPLKSGPDPAPIRRPETPAATTAVAPSDAIGSAIEIAARCQTLPELKAALEAFEGCALKSLATNTVFADGTPDHGIMFIGEAPGHDEDRIGLPFVGRAGKLLDKMLAAAGLTGRVFITNTVFWRPPGNRTPSPAEQAACAPFVERAIALLRPKVLMLAGGASAKHLLRTSEGILSLRGRWFEWKSEDGSLELPALPTLHPAFLLRQPAAKKKAWEDLMRLTERLDRPLRPS
jgi:uracil-DNA glycosylase family 4